MAYGRHKRPMNYTLPRRRRGRRPGPSTRFKPGGGMGGGNVSAIGPSGVRGGRGLRNRSGRPLPVPGTGGPGPMPRPRTRRKSRFRRPNMTY
jgi:hypothetical protein